MILFFRSCHDLNDGYPISCVGYGPCELLRHLDVVFFLPILPPTYHWTCCSAVCDVQMSGSGYISTYTDIHRHTNTYHWPWPNLTWNDHSQQISRIVWQRAVLAGLALIRQRHRYTIVWWVGPLLVYVFYSTSPQFFLQDFKLRGQEQQILWEETNPMIPILPHQVSHWPSRSGQTKECCCLGSPLPVGISRALLIMYRWRCRIVVPSQLEPLCHTIRLGFCWLWSFQVKLGQGQWHVFVCLCASVCILMCAPIVNVSILHEIMNWEAFTKNTVNETSRK